MNIKVVQKYIIVVESGAKLAKITQKSTKTTNFKKGYYGYVRFDGRIST